MRITKRTFIIKNGLIIIDEIDNCDENLSSYIYFHPSVTLDFILKSIHSDHLYCIENIYIPDEFNKLIQSYRISFSFNHKITMYIR